MENSNAIKLAQIVGVTSSVFLSGFSFSASYLSMPALGLAPINIRLKQWLKIYNLGKFVSPPLGLASGITWGLLSYSHYGSLAWKNYAAAGFLTFGGTVLWTVAVMMGTNNELMAMTKTGKGEKEGDSGAFRDRAETVLSSWDKMNWARIVLPLVGGAVGMWGML